MRLLSLSPVLTTINQERKVIFNDKRLKYILHKNVKKCSLIPFSFDNYCMYL